MKNNQLFIPIILIVIISLLGLGYYFNNKNKLDDNTTNGGNAEVLGAKTNQAEISVSDYTKKITDIRQPINKKIEDLMPKLKYTTLFQTNDIISSAEEIRGMIQQGLQTLNGLNISADLKSTDGKQVESLTYLKDAMDALIAMEKATDKTEKQKQLELFNYKIEESNRVIQGNSPTTNNNSSGTSNNSTVPLQ